MYYIKDQYSKITIYYDDFVKALQNIKLLKKNDLLKKNQKLLNLKKKFLAIKTIECIPLTPLSFTQWNTIGRPVDLSSGDKLFVKTGQLDDLTLNLLFPKLETVIFSLIDLYRFFDEQSRKDFIQLVKNKKYNICLNIGNCLPVINLLFTEHGLHKLKLKSFICTSPENNVKKYKLIDHINKFCEFLEELDLTAITDFSDSLVTLTKLLESNFKKLKVLKCSFSKKTKNKKLFGKFGMALEKAKVKKLGIHGTIGKYNLKILCETLHTNTHLKSAILLVEYIKYYIVDLLTINKHIENLHVSLSDTDDSSWLSSAGRLKVLKIPQYTYKNQKELDNLLINSSSLRQLECNIVLDDLRTIINFFQNINRSKLHSASIQCNNNTRSIDIPYPRKQLTAIYIIFSMLNKNKNVLSCKFFGNFSALFSNGPQMFVKESCFLNYLTFNEIETTWQEKEGVISNIYRIISLMCLHALETEHPALWRDLFIFNILPYSYLYHNLIQYMPEYGIYELRNDFYKIQGLVNDFLKYDNIALKFNSINKQFTSEREEYSSLSLVERLSIYNRHMLYNNYAIFLARLQNHYKEIDKNTIITVSGKEAFKKIIPVLKKEKQTDNSSACIKIPVAQLLLIEMTYSLKKNTIIPSLVKENDVKKRKINYDSFIKYNSFMEKIKNTCDDLRKKQFSNNELEFYYTNDKFDMLKKLKTAQKPIFLILFLMKKNPLTLGYIPATKKLYYERLDYKASNTDETNYQCNLKFFLLKKITGIEVICSKSDSVLECVFSQLQVDNREIANKILLELFKNIPEYLHALCDTRSLQFNPFVYAAYLVVMNINVKIIFNPDGDKDIILYQYSKHNSSVCNNIYVGFINNILRITSIREEKLMSQNSNMFFNNETQDNSNNPAQTYSQKRSTNFRSNFI